MIDNLVDDFLTIVRAKTVEGLRELMASPEGHIHWVFSDILGEETNLNFIPWEYFKELLALQPIYDVLHFALNDAAPNGVVDTLFREYLKETR